ncbi:helix-turn-helix domain-containing protein [Luteimonas flava]|uniref:helix-turn-helix domain-containing protein n=1 Tax=Luteimonas flava TaxID=3115822 RepID=UPI003CCCFE10
MARNLTQTELAEHAGVSKQTVERLVAGGVGGGEPCSQSCRGRVMTSAGASFSYNLTPKALSVSVVIVPVTPSPCAV